MDTRIGFYICHCGINIAGRVDVEAVADYVGKLPGVAVSRDYKFMCSDPGQEMIVEDIREHGLNRVVVASCSPRLHGKTFMGACQRAGLNPYYFQMASVREQVSWVTADSGRATDKAKSLARAAVNRVRLHESLFARQAKVHPDVLIVGGGITGMQAALDVADAGHTAYLVERQPTIGGHMLQFDKTFPTLDCAACIGTPKMVSVGQHPNIRLLTYSEVAEVNGFIGNYTVKVRRRPRYVDVQKCTGCGECGSVFLDEENPPRQMGGVLWADRLRIDETACIHCGECVSACAVENPDAPAMTHLVSEGLKALSSPDPPAQPSLFREVLLMSTEERKAFWDGQFRKCLKCYGCVDVCPVFLGWEDSLDPGRWMESGRVPPAYPLFHLLRAYNVWDLCVACGECERTCPAGIPLKTLHDLVRHLDPEEVLEAVPGLEEEPREAVLAFVAGKGDSSGRTHDVV